MIERAQAPQPAQVTSGLNLVLPLRDTFGAARPQKLAQLMAYIEERRPRITQALHRLNFVHFARFLPAEDGSSLSVITEFDGPLQPYVMDFIIAVGDEFSTILSYMEGWPEPGQGQPPIHVRDHPDLYWTYVREHNLVHVEGLRPFSNLNLYSAYPDRTVLEIVGPATEPAPPPRELPPEGRVDLADVQANLLRGIGSCKALHLALAVGDAAAAGRFLAAVTGRDPDLPQVSNAEAWPDDAWPEYRMTVGVTHDGLKALGVGSEDLARFPVAFQEGPAQWARAAALGDHGPAGPENWVLGSPGRPVHLLVSLYGYAGRRGEAALEARARALEEALAPHRLQTVHRQWVWVASDQREHFGYRDGISQPRVAGVPHSGSAGEDVQPACRAGEFLLGPDYVGVYGGRSIGQLPAALCTNASYAVVRMMAQDVAAFERLLTEGARATGQTEAWVAAKLMGRSQDGQPLVHPAVPPGAGDGSERTTNTYDYAPSSKYPALANDHEGLVCPVGAHARRMNPRHARVSGEPHSHRVMRRGMLYGPTRKEDPSLKQERGLYGVFVCADIERQFEFLQQVWANSDLAASGLRGTRDPIVGGPPQGAQDDAGWFRIPMADRSADHLLRVPRLVTTRGSLYLLMPGIAGLRHLAGLASATAAIRPVERLPLVDVEAWLSKPPRPETARLNTASFNPKSPAFTANPYVYYDLFRREAPVLPVQYGPYQGLWVFGHDLVDQVCNGVDASKRLLFHKPSQPARRLHPDPHDEPEARGLFYMDPPLHTQVRERLEPAVARHFGDAATYARQRAHERLARMGLRDGDVFDVVLNYTRPVTRDTLMHAMGIPEFAPDGSSLWTRFGKLAEDILGSFDPMQPLETQAEQIRFGKALGMLLAALAGGCPAHAAQPGLWCDMVTGGLTNGGQPLTRPVQPPLNKDDRAILFTAANFVLAGFLSVDFLLGNALALLLAGDGSGMAAYRAGDEKRRAAILAEVQRYDPPFQLADRQATQDTELGGVPIAAGTVVTVCYGSANHDPARFKDPERFDIDRVVDPRYNWVFGWDHHRCIGADVAPKITQAVLDALVEACPRLALDPAGPHRRLTDAYLRGHASLMLRA